MRRFMTSEIRFIRDNPQMSLKLIADFLGRSYNSVYDAIIRHGINRKIRACQPWSTSELRMLRKMRAQGMTYSEIGKRLGRSAKNCRNTLCRNRKTSVD